jgi:hypothetical protein
MSVEDCHTVDIVVHRYRWIDGVQYPRTTVWSVPVQPGKIYDITVKSLEGTVDLTLVMPFSSRRRSFEGRYSYSYRG